MTVKDSHDDGEGNSVRQNKAEIKKGTTVILLISTTVNYGFSRVFILCSV
jgi:hypothetical protein